MKQSLVLAGLQSQHGTSSALNVGDERIDRQAIENSLATIGESISVLRSRLKHLAKDPIETPLSAERAASPKEIYWRQNGYWIVG